MAAIVFALHNPHLRQLYIGGVETKGDDPKFLQEYKEELKKRPPGVIRNWNWRVHGIKFTDAVMCDTWDEASKLVDTCRDDARALAKTMPVAGRLRAQGYRILKST